MMRATKIVINHRIFARFCGSVEAEISQNACLCFWTSSKRLRFMEAEIIGLGINGSLYKCLHLKAFRLASVEVNIEY